MKCKMKRCDLEAPATGEETAPKILQEPKQATPRQRLVCFKKILDIVINMSDEKWLSLTKDVPNVVTKMEFEALCTTVVISASKAAIKQCLPSLIDALAIEAVLSVEPKLEKTETTSKSSSAVFIAADSSDSSARTLSQRLSVDLITDYFVSEVKMATQETVCEAASVKMPLTKEWKTTCPSVTEEMMNVPSTRSKDTYPLEMTGKNVQIIREVRETSKPDAAVITGKIVLVVLDVMGGGSAVKLDLKQTGDLLVVAAERMKQMASSSSQESLAIKVLFLGDKQKVPQDIQTKASRAVSQVLLSNIEGLQMNGSSELTSSLASQSDLDSMLGAMTQAGFATDSIFSHLDSTSRQIVQTIIVNMDVLSSASESHSAENHKCDLAKDSGLISVINHTFSAINEKVRGFFNVVKHPGKDNSETLSKHNIIEHAYKQKTHSTEELIGYVQPEASVKAVESYAFPRVQGDIDSSSVQVVCKDLDLNEMQVAKSSSSKICQVSQSTSFPALKESEAINAQLLISQGPTSQADLDFRAGPCNCSSTPTPSGDLHNVARTAGDVLDSLVDSSMIDGKRDSDTIVSDLESFSFVSSAYSLSGSDIANVGCVTTPCGLYKRVHGYLQGLFMSSSQEQLPLKCKSQRTVPYSALQLSTGHRVSLVDDLTATCTENVIGEIVNAYYSEISPEFGAPFEPRGSEESLVSHRIMHGVMQSLEKLTNKASSRSSVTNRDLVGRKEISFSNLDSGFNEDMPFGCSSDQVKEFISRFQNKATRVVSELLLTTGKQLALSVSTQCSMASSPSVSLTHVYSTLKEVTGTKPLSVAASSSSIKAQTTASAIMNLFVKRLRRLSSLVQSDNAADVTGPSPSQKNISSASRRMYRAIHKKVFRFLLGLQELSPDRETSSHVKPDESVNALLLSAMPSTVHPRIGVNIDHCTNEGIGKVVELYRSEVLLSKPSSSKVSRLHQSTSLRSAAPCDGKICMKEKSSTIENGAVNIMGTVFVDKHVDAMYSEMTGAKTSSSIQLKRADSGAFSDIPVARFPNSEEDIWTFTTDDDQANSTHVARGVVLKRLASVPKKLRHFFTQLKKSGQSDVRTADIKNDQLEMPDTVPLSMPSHSPTSLSVADQSGSPTFLGQVTPMPSASVKGQQMDIFGLSMKHSDAPVIALSRVRSALVRETLGINCISTQEGLSHYSSTSPASKSCSVDPVPVVVKRNHLGFRFIIPKKAPKIHVHRKKSNKVNPAGLVPDDHKPCSSGHLQESSHLEPKASTSSRKRCRKLLSLMCSAVSKALPNPFKCMGRRC